MSDLQSIIDGVLVVVLGGGILAVMRLSNTVSALKATLESGLQAMRDRFEDHATLHTMTDRRLTELERATYGRRRDDPSSST